MDPRSNDVVMSRLEVPLSGFSDTGLLYSDFNLPSFNWNDGKYNKLDYEFYKCILAARFTQHIKFLT